MAESGDRLARLSDQHLTQEFKNELLNSIFDKLRATFGHSTVPREGGVVRLYKALRRRGRVAILVDLSLRPEMPAVVIDCFGLKTMRLICACLVERANRRADRADPLRAVAERAMARCFSRETAADAGSQSSASDASLLGPVRAADSERSGAVALDLQTLAFSARKSGPALSVLRKFLSGIRRFGAGSERFIAKTRRLHYRIDNVRRFG